MIWQLCVVNGPLGNAVRRGEAQQRLATDDWPQTKNIFHFSGFMR